MKLALTPIGLIHSPQQQPDSTPIQPRYGETLDGTVVAIPAFAPGWRKSRKRYVLPPTRWSCRLGLGKNESINPALSQPSQP